MAASMQLESVWVTEGGKHNREIQIVRGSDTADVMETAAKLADAEIRKGRLVVWEGTGYERSTWEERDGTVRRIKVRYPHHGTPQQMRDIYKGQWPWAQYLPKKRKKNPKVEESPGALNDRVYVDYGLSRLEFREYPEIHGLGLEMIAVAQEDRGQGRARGAMEEIVKWADLTGTTLYLTPDALNDGTTGISLTKLKRFYRSLGFVKRPSGHGDFQVRDSMMREPKSLPVVKNPALNPGATPRKPNPQSNADLVRGLRF